MQFPWRGCVGDRRVLRYNSGQQPNESLIGNMVVCSQCSVAWHAIEP